MSTEIPKYEIELSKYIIPEDVRNRNGNKNIELRPQAPIKSVNVPDYELGRDTWDYSIFNRKIKAKL